MFLSASKGVSRTACELKPSGSLGGAKMRFVVVVLAVISIFSHGAPGFAAERQQVSKREKKRTKDREEPVSYVRKIPPPNLNKDLPTIVPEFAEDISKMMAAVCETGGRVAQAGFESNVRAAGVLASELRFARKEFGADVLAEVFSSKLDCQRGFIKVTSKFISGVWSSSLIEVTERDPMISFVLSRKEIVKVSMDEDCVAEDLILFRYDGLGYMSQVDFMESGFSAYRPVYEPLRSIAEIYTPAVLRKLGKTFEQINSVRDRTDRALVGIYDSGVDYNHPEIAYKIPAPRFVRTPAIDARLDQIRSVLMALRIRIAAITGGAEASLQVQKLRQESDALRREAQQYVTGWAFDRDDHMPFDFSYEPNNPFRQFSHHGTHVAGIVSQDTDVIGILPVRYPLRERDHFAAIKYAFESGARILNMSLASRIVEVFTNLPLALDTFSEMLFVVAAGNDGINLEGAQVWPTEFQRKNMISVASVDRAGKLDPSSNYSAQKVDIAALGVDVRSLAPMVLGGEATFSGTSQAAPQVTRVAAKLKFRYPRLTVAKIKEHLCFTAKKTDPEIMMRVRCGILDEARALGEVPKGL